jgi:hypothetical protein
LCSSTVLLTSAGRRRIARTRAKREEEAARVLWSVGLCEEEIGGKGEGVDEHCKSALSTETGFKDVKDVSV